MDALYEVMGANTPERRQKLDRYLASFRQEMSQFCFFSDPDLAPVLLALALVECRLANCQVRGVLMLLSKIYARNIAWKDVSIGEMPAPPDQNQTTAPVLGLQPDRPMADVPTPFVVGKDRDKLIDELTDRAVQITADFVHKHVEPEEFRLTTADIEELAANFTNGFNAVLGKTGVH